MSACVGLGVLSLCVVGPAAGRPLPLAESIVFESVRETASFTIDLATLPARPELIATATPAEGAGTHADIVLALELTGYQLGVPGIDTTGACPGPTTSHGSSGAPGEAVARFDFSSFCYANPTLPGFVDRTAIVNLSVVDFGLDGAPAKIDLSVRGETRVPFATASQELVTLEPVVVELPAQSDTTIYERSPTGSNGAGSFLWSGTDVSLVPPLPLERDAIRSLVEFDLAPIPVFAEITEATLHLQALQAIGAAPDVDLYRVAADASWFDGNADASGNEFAAGSTPTPAATWLARSTENVPWETPGGDFAPGGPIASLAGGSIVFGENAFASAALTDEVVAMRLDTSADQGFALASPAAFLSDQGVQFASADHPVFEGPRLRVAYLIPGFEGTLMTGVVSFIGEGEDFRWIYDVDGDDVLETAIGGICAVDPDFGGPNALPYTYDYVGTPGFVGHDCCTWQIDSPQTGTIGTGQALFFHNLDPSDPANMPPDLDGDGIRDLCDNCPQVPNGPAVGTCLWGAAVGEACHSNEECAGAVCSLSQHDSDFDFEGDACLPAPEPGLSCLLGAGVLLIVWRSNRALEPSR